MRPLFLFLAGLGALASSTLAAQAPAASPAWTCDPLHPTAGAARGRVVADTTGAPVDHRAVYIAGGCMAVTRDDGTFVLRGVPPGAHRLEIAPLGFRPHPPVPFVLRGGDTADVGTIRLRPDNHVAECLEEPGCAALLRPDPAATRELGDDERLQEAALRTALALVHRGGGPGPVVPCAPATDARVFAALAARFPGLVPAAECALPATGPDRLSARLTHTPTGRPALSVRVEDVERHGDAATVHSGYYVAPLNAMTWECRLVREGEHWTPRSCRVVAVS